MSVFEIKDATGWHVATRAEYVRALLIEGATPEEIRANAVYQEAPFRKRRELDAILGTSTGPEPRPSGPEWIATVKAYRRWQVDNPDELPSQELIARARKVSEDTLARRLRKLGVRRWQDVHALVESEPGA